jgi:hypothetical protein
MSYKKDKVIVDQRPKIHYTCKICCDQNIGWCFPDTGRHYLPDNPASWIIQEDMLQKGSFGLSATSQQYFSLRTNQPPATSQQYFSLTTNQHQPPATSQTNRLSNTAVLLMSPLFYCCGPSFPHTMPLSRPECILIWLVQSGRIEWMYDSYQTVSAAHCDQIIRNKYPDARRMSPTFSPQYTEKTSARQNGRFFFFNRGNEWACTKVCLV